MPAYTAISGQAAEAIDTGQVIDMMQSARPPHRKPLDPGQIGILFFSWILTACAVLFLFLNPGYSVELRPVPAGSPAPAETLQVPAAETAPTAPAAEQVPLPSETVPAPADQQPAPAVLRDASRYAIAPGTLVAPAPDQKAFAVTGSVPEMCRVLSEASDLLNLDGWYFSEKTELLPGSVIHYYSDDSIIAVSWKEGINGTVYTFSEVSVAHPSQFRRFMAGGSFGSGQLALTTEMSATVNAVVAASGDYYDYRGTVISVMDGEVLRCDSGWLDVCFVDYDGNFHFIDSEQINRNPNMSQIVTDFVRDNNINFCLEFGPILYDHGEVEIEWGYPAGACGKGRARSAICQMGPRHYMVVDANMEDGYMTEPTIYDFAGVIASIGCESAFALDGGQTASTAMNHQLVNQVSYGSPRAISDIIYFATGVTNGG